MKKLPGNIAKSKNPDKLVNSIFEYLSGIKLPKNRNLPLKDPEQKDFLSSLLKDYPSNHFLASLLGVNLPVSLNNQRENSDIWSMNYKDMLRFYYDGLLRKTGGNKREAAKLAEVKYQTFCSRLDEVYHPKKSTDS